MCVWINLIDNVFTWSVFPMQGFRPYFKNRSAERLLYGSQMWRSFVSHYTVYAYAWYGSKDKQSKQVHHLLANNESRIFFCTLIISNIVRLVRFYPSNEVWAVHFIFADDSDRVEINVDHFDKMIRHDQHRFAIILHDLLFYCLNNYACHIIKIATRNPNRCHRFFSEFWMPGSQI